MMRGVGLWLRPLETLPFRYAARTFNQFGRLLYVVTSLAQKLHTVTNFSGVSGRKLPTDLPDVHQIVRVQLQPLGDCGSLRLLRVLEEP